MPDEDSIEGMVKGINQILTEVISDIKVNTGKKNIQTTEENKVRLKKISKDLQIMKNKLTNLYSSNTTQTTLNIK
tara:strand:- start:4582 stop:4806 length:225 start_codon:yes stop_codon:yes gene_type:complete